MTKNSQDCSTLNKLAWYKQVRWRHILSPWQWTLVDELQLLGAYAAVRLGGFFILLILDRMGLL